MVDNSQGHSAYSEDALLVSCMNMNPGRKQPRLWNGWYMRDGFKVTQEMNFPISHPKFPGKPKGIKHILMEHG